MIFVLNILWILILLNLILLNVLRYVWLVLSYLNFILLWNIYFQIFIFTGLWILVQIVYCHIIFLRLDYAAVVQQILILHILDLRVNHLICLTWIIWIHWLLKRGNLGNFVLGKSIFIWFLERLLKILLLFRICFIA